MTNLEYLLSDEWRENLIAIIKNNVGVRTDDGAPVLCEQIYCADCRFCAEPCNSAVDAWLKEEHPELPAFQKGTIVEVLDGDNSRVGYYNGVYKNQHYVVDKTGFIGETNLNGVPYGDAVELSDLRKVGE